MNWGQKIVVMLGIFILFIVTLGYFMIKASNKEHAEDDYYEKGVNYTQEYNRKSNVLKDALTPEIKLAKDSLLIIFHKASSGRVFFERPSDGRLDFDEAFNTNASNLYALPTSRLASGPWKIRVEWEKYLYDYELSIP